MNRVYLDDGDATLWRGDATECLRQMPAGSVHMCVTSPPFYGLRDYQVPGQIGLENSPDEWADQLVQVFQEVRRVLRDDGTLWVECGDSYCASPPGNVRGVGETSGLHKKYRQTLTEGHGSKRDTSRIPGLKQKDLIGSPWLLAFKLRQDGWYLRSCIIWQKPNPMPESVTDRPTTAHSYLFLFSKKPRYFWDAEALREPAERAGETPGGHRAEVSEFNVNGGGWASGTVPAARNARSVWTIATEPNGLAVCRECDGYWERNAPQTHCGVPVVQHFAAFPRELVRRCVLAGTSERGVCPECGAPWERVTEDEYVKSPKHGAGSIQGARGASRTDDHRDGGRANKAGVGDQPRVNKQVTTLGWQPTCGCFDFEEHDGTRNPYPPVPATVLDPFAGSGTTMLVARQHGRRSVGVELNRDYCRMIDNRLRQRSLLAG